MMLLQIGVECTHFVVSDVVYRVIEKSNNSSVYMEKKY